MGTSKKASPQDKLVASIDRLAVQTERLERSVTALANMMGRVVFPAEAMEELTGCLRAVVYVLDTDKQFSHLVAQRRRAPAPPAEAPSSKAGG